MNLDRIEPPQSRERELRAAFQREWERRFQAAAKRIEWANRVRLLQEQQDRFLQDGKYSERRLRKRLQDFGKFDFEDKVIDEGGVVLGGAKYNYATTFWNSNEGKGISVFYAHKDSCTPYHIIMYNHYYITEYRLVDLGQGQFPTELLLRLSRLVLKAHQKNVVLGPLLNLANIKWDVVQDMTGLPYVEFRNLPPANSEGPPPPPKWPVPGLPDPGGSTMESDIYCTPLVLFQIIEKLENSLEMAMEVNGPEIREIESKDVTSRPIEFVDDKPAIPSVIAKNGALCRIVRTCFAEDPAKRPTASQLVKLVRKLALKHLYRDVGKGIGGWVISMLKNVTFRSD